MRWTTVAILAATLFSAAADRSWSQFATINFDVATGDWNVVNNWVTAEGFNFIPGDNFPDEIAGISNGGTVNLTEPADFDVFGLVIGENHDPAIPNPTEEDGTLNISGGGQLRLVDPDGQGGAALRIGDAGRGVLNLTGGSVSADTLSVGGADDSALNISGSAILGISSSASLGGGITRIEGPNVTFDVEGDVSVSGTFVPVITGAAHSAITSAGSANMGGTLRVEFNGHVPSLGDTWTLIDASAVSGTFDNIDVSQAGAIPRGTTLDVLYDQAGSGDVVLSFSNRLIMTVDAVSGDIQINNVIGADIDLDGYTIVSPGGNLSTGGWSSLQSQGLGAWQEALPGPDRLTELSPTDATTMSAGGLTLDLGAAYAPANFQDVPDLTFQYTTLAGEILDGFVEVLGINSLVLMVDPTTGESHLRNPTSFAVDLSGYSILSESGSLLPGGFGGIGQGDWQLANPSANHLSELNPSESTILNSGADFNLGNIFDSAGTMDLVLDFHLRGTGGEVLTGGVVYDEVMGEDCIVGDTSPCNQAVDINDLNAVRNNFGTGDGSDTSGIPGDAFPFDGLVDINDLNGVRNTFGNTAAPAAVPEPSSLVLCGIGLMGTLCFLSRRWSRR